MPVGSEGFVPTTSDASNCWSELAKINWERVLVEFVHCLIY